jgi:hypothetical protein
METSSEKPPIDFGPSIDVIGASQRAIDTFGKGTGESDTVGSKSRKRNSKKSNAAKSNGVPNEPIGAGIIEPEETKVSVSRETVERAIKSLISIIDDSVQRAVGGRAKDISGDETLADVYREKVAVKPDEREQISTLSADVCEQYGLLGQHAALLFLFVFVTTYISRVGLTIRNLNKLAADKEKILAKKQTETKRTDNVSPTIGTL